MASDPKILFMSTWVNNPEFMVMQRDLIRKFCKEPTDFIAVLDGKEIPCFTNFGDTSMRRRQINCCQGNKISFLEVPPETHIEPARMALFPNPSDYNINCRNPPHDPSSRTAVANQYGYNHFLTNLRSKYDYLVMIQSDIFPFCPFSVVEFLGDKSLLYTKANSLSDDKTDSLDYAWDGFLMFNFKVDPTINWSAWNFDSGFQTRGIFTDTGGGTWKILDTIQKKEGIHNLARCRWTRADPLFETLPKSIQDFVLNDGRNEGDNLACEIKHRSFIHLVGGGNWMFIHNVEEGFKIQTECNKNFFSLCLKLLV